MRVTKHSIYLGELFSCICYPFVNMGQFMGTRESISGCFTLTEESFQAQNTIKETKGRWKKRYLDVSCEYTWVKVRSESSA